MEVNLIKSNMKTLKKVAESENEVNYEWDIIVPDSKPDIQKIIKADAVCSVTDKEIMQDRAMVTGNVFLSVMYLPANETGMIRSIESNQSFNSVLELEGLRQNMRLNCWPEVVSCEASAINSRKMKIKTRIRLNAAANTDDEIMYINGVEGEDIEFLKKDISACRKVSDSENRMGINESFELPLGKPSAEEIIKTFVKITDRDIRAMNEKILVKGEVSAIVIYSGANEGEGIQFLEYTIPFTEVFDEPGITEGASYDADFKVENLSCFVMPDQEGENRIINISADIAMYGKGYENITFEAVVDAYGKECEIDIEKSDYEFDEIINCCENRTMIKETVDFGKIDEINKVINIIGEEYVKSVTLNKNSVTVEGGINIDLLYNSHESELPVSFVTKEIPFCVTLDCAGADENTICEVKTDIISLAYNIINAGQMELRITMDIKIRLKRPVEDKVLSNITVVSENACRQRDGIVIYFCDNNEKVWDIAKKYRTTVDEIMDANELSSEEDVRRGTKLLIP